MMAVLVILVVSASLIVGAVWGVRGRISVRTEGFVVALAGGALVVAAVLELIDPALDVASLWAVAAAVLAGAGTFTAVDRWIERRFGSDSGGGLLAAITLDGVPENLALGVALIGAEPVAVAALSGSILLSNLPEAAGGARDMAEEHGGRQVLLLWTATAALLSLAALAGYFLLTDAPPAALGLIQAFAGGAVVASLATAVFPKAFKDDSYASGMASAIGVLIALSLDRLS